MITSVVFLILVATVPLLGGQLSKLGEIRLRGWWSIAASLVIQIVLIEVLSDALDGVVAAALHLASYGLAFIFVWVNRHVVGMGIIVLGGVLNAAAIAANGGVMPARLEALQTAGIISDSPTFENSAPIENARLSFLGDVFAIPEGIPFANVFSVGDLLLVFGAGLTVHIVAESRLGRKLRPTNAVEPTPDAVSGRWPVPDPPTPEPAVTPSLSIATASIATASIATASVATGRPSLALRYQESVRRAGGGGSAVDALARPSANANQVEHQQRGVAQQSHRG